MNNREIERPQSPTIIRALSEHQIIHRTCLTFNLENQKGMISFNTPKN